MEIATSRHGLRITRGVVAAWIGVCLSLCAAQRAYVPADWAFLRILNPRSPGDDRIRVLQGDPVVVAFDVNPQIVGPRPTDELQLRRVDDGSTVSRQPRGPGLSGTAYLDTGAANAIGELRVVYVETATQAVRGDAGETLSVLAGAGPPPSSITVPSATVPSIQMAIGMVADGGTIRIRPGTYRERLFIAGKRVHITSLRRSLRPNVILAADRPGSILPAAEALGVINFGTGGGGSIDNLLVSGGDAGIMGTGDGEQRPGAVTIQNTILSANGRGVLGTFSELTVRSSTVVGAQWHAYHLYDLFALLLLDGIIYDTGGAGILAYNFRTGPGSIHIRNQKVSRFSQGGIVVVGDAKPVTIEGCTASYGAVAGILLAGVGTADVAGCRVVGIHGVDIAGVRQYGDGLMLLGCEAVHVARSKFLLCERAGILAYQSAGELQRTECLADVFGLAILEDSEVLFGEDCHFKGGEQDIYNYGSANLAVPNEATPIPDRPE